MFTVSKIVDESVISSYFSWFCFWTAVFNRFESGTRKCSSCIWHNRFAFYRDAYGAKRSEVGGIWLHVRLPARGRREVRTVGTARAGPFNSEPKPGRGGYRDARSRRPRRPRCTAPALTDTQLPMAAYESRCFHNHTTIRLAILESGTQSWR